MASTLNQKRILVTDIDSDFGKEVANALVAEGALVFTLVKECRAMQQVLEEYPQLTPILLDIGKEKGEDQARKLILSLPAVDHFVNLSEVGALNIMSQAYPNAKIHEVTDIKSKPIINKMIESGGRCLIFNVSFGNQNIMSKLKANLDPRYTNSKTANFRLSLKKMFSSGNKGEGSSTQAANSRSSVTPTAANGTDQPIVRETNAATNFAALATSLSNTQAANGHSSTDAPASTSNGAAPSSRTQTLQEKNNKIRSSVLKLDKSCAKKWEKTEKRIAKEHQSALKSLHKEIEKSKKIEKSNIMKQISDVNASTVSRSNALSEDTANKILEARENRADKEVEKHAQKKLEKETSIIIETKDTKMTESHEKLYKKTVDKQINEFNKIKSKYLV